MSSADGLISEFRKIGCIVHSEKTFVLKSGQTSNLYIDMRKLVAHPNLLRGVALQMLSIVTKTVPNFDYFAGIVAGGIPLAVMLSQVHPQGKGMLMVRTERKTHGTGRLIEGLPSDHQGKARIVLVEDVISTGSSVCETIEKLRNKPVEVVACVCAVNRSTVIRDTLPGTTIPLYSRWVLSDIVQDESMSKAPTQSTLYQELMRRASLAQNRTAAIMFHRIAERKTNLIWSADIMDGKELLVKFKLIAPYIIAIKLHFDATKDLDHYEFQKICEKHLVMVLSDRKYADIESTVRKQISLGSHEPLANAATVHPVAGAGSVRALAHFDIASVLVAEMSNGNRLTSAAPDALDIARQNPANILGFVCQHRQICDSGDGFVYFTPGVHLDQSTDGADQRYRDCDMAIGEQGCDVVIVGRGISEAEIALVAAMRYQTAAWEALKRRMDK